MDVRMPDGTIVTNVPDGITQAELLKRYQASTSSANASDLLPKTLSIAGYDTNIPLPQSVGAGLVKAGHVTSNILSGIADLPNLITGNVNQQRKQAVEQGNADVAPLEKQFPVSTLLGGALPYFAVPVGATGNALAAAGRAALAGAIPAALEYGTPAERAQRAAMSAAGGAGGSLLGSGIARAFGPESMRAGNATNQWGIPLRTAQTTESKPVQVVDAVLQNLPFSSGVIGKAKDASYEGFRREVAKTFGKDTADLSPEVLGAARSQIGGTIGDLAERNTLLIDKPLAIDIARVSQRASANLTTDEAKIVSNKIAELERHIDPSTGTVPGTLYRAWRSDVGELAKSSGGTLGNVLGDLRQSVTKAMDRSISPQDAATWAKANREYFNVKQVADAAKQTPGTVSPTQLLQSINRNQPNARFGAGNDLAELAQWAKPTLGDAIPNSGTAQRLFYQALVTHPWTMLGAGAGLGGGLHYLGATPEQVAEGMAVPYLLSRGMAGKPLSEATKAILRRGGGGLLSYSGANAPLLLE